jgi:hypothetical protein
MKGALYLKVVKRATKSGRKSFPQYHLENGHWVKGAPAGRACGRLGRGNSRRYGRTGVVKVTGDDAVDKNRAERTSANDLTQVQENASELVRSVGDVAGKFIKEQPFTAALIALGIVWLLGRTHRPL